MKLEIKSNLTAEDEGIINISSAARIYHVLNVGLKEDRPFPKIKPICPFHDRFVVLHTHRWIKLLLPLLGVAQVAAETAINDPETHHINRTRFKYAATGNSRR